MKAALDQIADIDTPEALEMRASLVGAAASKSSHGLSRVQVSPKWVDELKAEINPHSAGVRW
jgi:hypothetical protein